MKQNHLSLSLGLRQLVEASAAYWGAEAEVIRSYWDSPIRSKETDRKWLIHQVYKEYCNGVVPYLEMLNKNIANITTSESRHKLLEASEIVYEEIEHFSMFSDLYSMIDGSDYKLTPEELSQTGCWQENDELMSLRKKHRQQSESLGDRAMRFTEGGYVALFSEGMKLAGRNAFDSAVAEVCKRIHDDEFSHMLIGIVETDCESLSVQDWETLQQFTVEQLKKRILMRNAQFSYPISETRINEMLEGKALPVKFDFEYASRLLSNEAA